MEPIVEKTSFTLNFRKLPGAALIALLAISGLYFIEIRVLPINFFTFRLWEAMDAEGMFLPGSFFPNMKISMVETGDLGHHTEYAVKKNVEWETDRYGYRKKDTGINRYRVVIAGDSDIAGTGLTQKDMLSEVLERRLKVSVYPFTKIDFLHTKRFIETPPDIVILGVIERNIPNLRCSKTDAVDRKDFLGIKNRIGSFMSAHQRFAAALTRIGKNNMARYFVIRINDSIKRRFYRLRKQEWLPSEAVHSTADKKILFVKETVDNMAGDKDIPPEKIDRIVDTIACYAQICGERGSRFIFLPIPDKENIYYKYVPVKNITKPKFLERLISKLRGAGIEVIDTQKAFDDAFLRKNMLLYNTDDTHWNAAGVMVAADLVEKALQKDPRSSEKFQPNKSRI